MGCFDALLKWISRRDHLGVNTSFLLGWGAVLEQSVAYLPISVSKRTLLSVWLTFSLIIVSAYKSSLIANLSVQGKVNTPETLSDLVRAKNWKWGTEEFVFKGYPFEYFSKHKDPIVHKVYMAMKVLPPDVALRRVMKGHFSMVNYENYVIIYINTHFTDSRGRTPFQLSRRSLAIMAAYGWGLRKGAPFYNSYRHLITHMQAGGLMDYWKQQVVIESKKKSKEAEPFTYDSSREYSKDESVKVVLGLTHLDGAFYLFFLGTAAAFFTFFVEIITGRGHNKT